MRPLLASAALALCASCTYDALPKLVADHDLEARSLAVELDRSVDLLFLIDDSPSMSDKQDNLVGNFSQLLSAISVDGSLPDLHLAVATSDLGTADTRGVVGPSIGMVGQGGCGGRGKDGAMQVFGAPVTGVPFATDVALPGGGRQRNYTGELADVFTTMAKAGAAGCGFEQTLEAMRRALDPGNAVNRGFVRPEATLAVVFITDEDDCSLADSGLLGASEAVLGPLQSFRCTRYGVACDTGGGSTDEMNQVGVKAGCHPRAGSPYLTDVAGYAAFLRQLKPDPTKLVVAGVMGTLDPIATELRAVRTGGPLIPALAHSCMYVRGDGMSEVADPPVRLAALLDAFPNRAARSSICQRDVSASLREIGSLLKHTTGDACFASPLIDINPGKPGDQRDCEVTQTPPVGAPAALARCEPDDATARNAPCWRLVTDPVGCPAGAHDRIVIEGLGELLDRTQISARCAIARGPA